MVPSKTCSIVSLLVAFACGDRTYTPTGPSVGSGTRPAAEGYAGYRERLRAVRDIRSGEPTAAQATAVAPACSTIERNQGVYFARTAERKHLESTLSDLVVFNANRDTVWPGALLRWSSLSSGNPARIDVPRTPVEIWLDVSHSPNIRRAGVTARGSSVHTAINELLIANPTGYAAGIDFNYSEVHTVEQSLLELGISAEWLTGSATASLTEKKKLENHVVLASFTQVYYSVVYEPPSAGNHTVLPPGLDHVTLDEVFDKEDPPVYISQVNYGRRMLFRLESELTFSEVKSALEVVQDFAAGKATLELANEAMASLRSTEIKLVIKGGDPNPAARVITTQDFLQFITSGLVPSASSPGVPVSYTVKQLRDNALVAFKRMTDFDAVDYSRLARRVRVVIERMHVHDDGDALTDGAGDFIWTFKVNGKVVDDQQREVDISTGNTHRIDASTVLELPLTDAAELVIEGRITEVDGTPTGGGSDVITLRKMYPVSTLTGTRRDSLRGSDDGSPSVEVFWRIEVLGENLPAPACSGTSAAVTPIEDSAVASVGASPTCGGDCPVGQRARPFYLIAHRRNDLSSVEKALRAGANAIEFDVRFDRRNDRFCVNHDTVMFCDRDELRTYLRGLRRLADRHRHLALVVVDFKGPGDATSRLARLLSLVRAQLSDAGIVTVVSVARWADRGWLRGAGPLKPGETLAIDEDDHPRRVAKFLRGLGVRRPAYGNGACVVCPIPPERSFDDALRLREAGQLSFVYVWTLAKPSSMKRFIAKGVDGIMVNDVSVLRELVCDSCSVRLATRADNPFA